VLPPRFSGWGTVSAIACVVISMVALSFRDSLVKWLGVTYPLHERPRRTTCFNRRRREGASGPLPGARIGARVAAITR
jgi:hypothetical protein